MDLMKFSKAGQTKTSKPQNLSEPGSRVQARESQYNLQVRERLIQGVQVKPVSWMGSCLRDGDGQGRFHLFCLLQLLYEY